MEIQIPDKLYQIMQKVAPEDLQDWITTVLEDATEDCVFAADDDSARKEWHDYCASGIAASVDSMFKGIVNEQE